MTLFRWSGGKQENPERSKREAEALKSTLQWSHELMQWQVRRNLEYLETQVQSSYFCFYMNICEWL
jgi:hypothetical protein